jgi:hypothetical protein
MRIKKLFLIVDALEKLKKILELKLTSNSIFMMVRMLIGLANCCTHAKDRQIHRNQNKSNGYA